MNETLRTMLIDGAARMGLSLDEAAVHHFSRYLDLLRLWGAKINLTTRREDEEVVVYHFLDSLAGASLLAASPASRIVDLGAGAGLPSLPLKFALPDLQVVLVESVRKKVAFCQEVIRATGIAGACAVWGRGEDLARSSRYGGTFDWAVSRALGQSADVARLARPFLAPGGRVLLYKGEPSAAELQALERYCAEQGAVREIHPVTIPFLQGVRTFIVVSFSDQETSATG